MPITSDMFEAYLKCPTKCFLRSLGETGTNNSYANWVRTQYLSYSSERIKRIRPANTRLTAGGKRV
jgi:hypothetical protein